MDPYRVIDCHVHCDNPSLIQEGIPAILRCGIERLAALSYGHLKRGDPHVGAVSSNPAALAAKSLFPEKVYAFGGFNHAGGLGLSERAFSEYAAQQARRLIEIGFDGVKLLESKPSFYPDFPHHLHERVFEGFFSTLEERGMPVLWHVGDPATFWDPQRVPAWARTNGWYYGGGDFPSLEQLYAEAWSVLDRHPRLKVIFAHFHFLAGDLKRLASLFERFRAVHVDITPGTEMYSQFSVSPARTREFFQRFGDRILFGTDTALHGESFDAEALAARLHWMRGFLETEDRLRIPDREGEIRGLALPQATLRAIYEENFLRLVGASPAGLNRQLAMAECERISELSRDRAGAPGGADVAEQARQLIAAGGPR
jgi:predicted TIM-barrel fold metal-dependent hydrolase